MGTKKPITVKRAIILEKSKHPERAKSQEKPIDLKRLDGLVPLVDATLAIEKVRVQAQVRISHLKRNKKKSPDTDELFQRISALEKWVDGKIADHLKSHPAYPWFSKIKGIGNENIAKVVGLIDIEKDDTISSLWSFCFPANAMIATTNGYKPISELTLADRVIGKDSEVHEINKLFSRNYDGNMITIKAKKMLPIQATPDHPFLTASVSKLHNETHHRTITGIGWKAAKDVTKGDWLIVPRLKLHSNGHYTFMDTKHPLNPDMAYLFGRFVADGSTSIVKEGTYYRGNTCLTYGKDEKPIQVMENPFGLTTTRKLSKPLESSKQQYFGRYHTARFFRHSFGDDSMSKKIPDFIVESAPDITKAFLTGYLDGDGCWYRPKRDPKGVAIAANTVSLGLALQLQLLTTKLGVLPSLFIAHKKGETKIRGKAIKCQEIRYQLNIPKKDAELVFPVDITGNRRCPIYLTTDDSFLVPISEVSSSSYTGKVYNIKCDGSTYLVNNCIVHNCGLAPNSKRIKGEKLHYNSQLRTMIFRLATSLLRAKGKFYEEYLRYKDFYEKRCERDGITIMPAAQLPKKDGKIYEPKDKISEGHIHMLALRRMSKQFMADLWITWREGLGLPTRPPYLDECVWCPECNTPAHIHTVKKQGKKFICAKCGAKFEGKPVKSGVSDPWSMTDK